MLFCTETVTFARLSGEGEGYVCTVIEGVSRFWKTEAKLQQRGVSGAAALKIRIPADALPEGFMPEPGDLALPGAVSALMRRAELAELPHAKVTGVADNRRGGLPHVAVSCE